MLKRTRQIISAKTFYIILFLLNQLDRLPTLTSNIRLGWKCIVETNAPTYFSQNFLYMILILFSKLDRLHAVTSNIRLGLKCIVETNTLTYYSPKHFI
jgi:hypothetical protein